MHGQKEAEPMPNVKIDNIFLENRQSYETTNGDYWGFTDKIENQLTTTENAKTVKIRNKVFMENGNIETKGKKETIILD